MRTWWVCAWDCYYPDGGLLNVKGTFATEEAASECAVDLAGKYDRVEIYHIVDKL